MKLSNLLKSALPAAVLGCLALGFGSTSAVAASTQTTFAVTATVQATCLISASGLAFGTYTGAQVDAASSISVTCTNTTPYDVALNAGTSASATVTTRKMTGPGTDLLGYALFSDTTRTANWGNTAGVDGVHGIGSGANQTLTVFGRVAAAQYVSPGAYTDTITATISY